MSSLRCIQTDKRAHFGEEPVHSPKKKKKKIKSFTQKNDQATITAYSSTNFNNNVVSEDTLSEDTLVTSMEPSNTSSVNSVNSFNEDLNSFNKDLEIEQATTQAKIDVKNCGDTLPSLCDPGYMLCTFQNIGLNCFRDMNQKHSTTKVLSNQWVHILVFLPNTV